MNNINKENFEQWNEKMARKYNPDTYHSSSNLFIKHIENQRVKSILDLLKIEDSDEVIEIGCGAGNILEKINKGRLVGIDLSDFLLEMAKKKLKDKKVYLLKANAEDLPQEIKNKKYDKVICSEVIEHVQCPHKVIDEISKIIHSKSTIVISVPNEGFINKLKQIFIKLKIFFFFFPNISKKMDNEWHLHSFDLALLRKITQGKLKIEKIKPIPFWFFPIRYVVKFKPLCSIRSF